MVRIPLPLRPTPPAVFDQPIRAELFGVERLERHAESLAEAQRVIPGSRLGRPLLPRVEENARVLRESNRLIADSIHEERWITPAAEWLVDNFFVVDEQLREIRDDLPAQFYVELPKLADGPLAGYPRVYGIAWAFVAHTDSRFDPEMLRRFVLAYQRVRPLTIGELWAVAIALRVVLVENLRRLAEAMTRNRQARQEADALADDLLGLGVQGVRSVTGQLHRVERAPLVTAFAVELVQRLRDQDPAVTPALAWLHQRLAAQGTTPDEISLDEHQQQAAMTVTVRNVITSMRLLSAFDWKAFFESVSLVDDVLRTGPTYAAMDFTSRDSYRHAIEEMARGSGYAEIEVAREAMVHADRGRSAHGDGPEADAGFYLVGRGRRAFERTIGFHPPIGPWLVRAFIDLSTPAYLGAILAATILLLVLFLAPAAAGGLHGVPLLVMALLALVPASDLAIAVINRAVTAILPPTLPPRLELAHGIPTAQRTMVVIPTLLGHPAEIEEQLERLEVHYLANAEGDVTFALLTDWVDATAEHVTGDDELLSLARDGIAHLNSRHGATEDGGDRFLLLHRQRRWNAREGLWMGWERKRGKLHELNRLLRGATDTTFAGADGVSPRVPPAVHYVVTLDADTRLPIDAVRQLVGTMAHPLNWPVIDPATRRVVKGYAVLQPRVTPPLPGRTGSLYQQLVSGAAGIDPYAAAVSDVYQDLFGEGSYTGKGIYDVDAFEMALDGRVPENALLSHDLFESLYARTCLVTDIEFFEMAPVNYLAATARQHRWARGDWQLLPWILRGRVPAIGRWKMVDNLRRTLLAPTAFLVLAASWLWVAASPALWLVFLIAVLGVPALFPVLSGVWPRRPGISKRSHVRGVQHDLWTATRQVALGIVTLAHQAYVMADAILRTLFRITLSRRHLLEWTPAGSVARRVPTTVLGFYGRMAAAVLVAIAILAAVGATHPEGLPIAVPVTIAWILSPAIMWWASRPGSVSPTEALSPEDAENLRLIARSTWRFFTAFVTTESHALPPDNFQEVPRPVVAQRTSPTNIGLYLLSAVSARDLGWIGTCELVERLEATLATLRALEHYRGHLYNWYDTGDRRPLEPRYVSSVDSGNLAGTLIAISNACREIAAQPLLVGAALSGVSDAAALLRQSAGLGIDEDELPSERQTRLANALDVVGTLQHNPPEAPAEWAARLAELESAAHAAADCAADLAGTSRQQGPSRSAAWSDELEHTVATHLRDLDTLMPWAALRLPGEAGALVAADTMPPLAALPLLCRRAQERLAATRDQAPDESPTVRRQLDDAAGALERSASAATALLARLNAVADETMQVMHAMDFSFLLDKTRMLFAIGYRMSDGTLDSGRYDLLASEARLLSYIAIAKGDVPVQHWFRLGRPLTPVGQDSMLLSWSGSMFEYLMPALMMRTPVGSLLEQSCRLAVRRQIDYGAERGVPWGVSESAYNVRDFEMTYQYSNFGVPGLGLKRGLADDIVIAPYATALAAMVDPTAAVRNFAALAKVGAQGPYGFYESVDYTAPRLPAGTSQALVRVCMAHHQGMAVVAIANVLNGGMMRNRFHAEPIVRASELLLQERTPRDVAVARPHFDSPKSAADVRELVPPNTRHFTSPHGATPRTHLLSNGRYAVMLTAAGGGYSRWRDQAITRWREDVTQDDSGSWIFLRDLASGERWSAGFQPSGDEPESYDVSFSEDRAEILRRDGAITTRLEVIVSSEDDAEVRRVSLSNTGSRVREIEVTSYAEVVLAPAAADAAHPAFSNLFVQTECLADRDTLLATRRPRSHEDAAIWLAQVLAVEGEVIGDLEWETDRAQFVGRGRTVRNAHAVGQGRALSNTTGSVLDPVVALRRRVRIRPGKTVRLVFATVVAPTRDGVLDLADKYHDVTTFERVATLAWTQAQVQLHHLGVGPDEAHLFQTLAGSVLYADRGARAAPEILARQSGGAPSLWAHGISGDLPIVLVQIDETDDIGIVRQLLRAHEYWRMKRLAVDLVILNNRAPSYVQDLQTLLETLVRSSRSAPSPEGQAPTGGVFMLRTDRITGAQCDTLETAARVVLQSRRGTLAAQIARAQRAEAMVTPLPRRPRATPPVRTTTARREQLEFANTLGGFADDGREYAMVLRDETWTPAPWVNVIANADFGCLVSESGTGATWSVNSQENQLTNWSNDPVSNPPSDTFYLRDDTTGEVWSATPLPIREPGGEYTVRHGHGYSRFGYGGHGIDLDLLLFVPADDPVRVSRLTITNTGSTPRRLSVTAYLQWVLGVSRAATAPFIVTEMDNATGAMFARNTWSRDFSQRIAFADLLGAQTAWTGDRTEFLGRNGALDAPAALNRREPLSGRVGAALDPCCALQTPVVIPPGDAVTVVLVLGQAASREAARALIEKYRSADLEAERKNVAAHWDTILGAVQVHTPDRALDVMLNRWLLYQTLGCRIWARTAFYQASGAYGFRDQLQDVLALLVARPDVAREQILRAAGRQFLEGDVQHWWHEPAGRGVRTRISDDLLWLPYVAAQYADATGDHGVLDAMAPFLEGPVLAAGQAESYFEPRVSTQQGTIYEHCARALDRSLATGAHGLPLIGTGDWNDGMNHVGAAGKGESVWMAWFLCGLLDQWAPIAATRGDTARDELWREHALALRGAVERDGWDGAWYRRAYFDDGTPLGSATNDACAIDSIAQSWSVISGAGDAAHARQAMESLDQRLVDREHRIVLLLAPPFDHTALEPGYIKGYVPGVRENGGQYTHAAAWAVIAFAQLGDGARAAELLTLLNPITHATTAGALDRYKVEPYVVAADVYSQAPHAGRGGWTWYTGSAGWLYRSGVEWLLGLRMKGDRLIVDPCIPAAWPGFSATVRHGNARYEVTVENPDGRGHGIATIELDGTALEDLTAVPLVADGQVHRVRVVIGTPRRAGLVRSA
ncbi:MAG TPA: glucoamylase family protein [Gemmatimonadales bacterium]|jgi:cyclic beta-1,2-glucan synthetase|nr:glucoamylase family protein [Gemmatimonadales bacterium]